ncbi:hypothetical protein HYALB_00000742 [Hymenoscyphus albidus]|uniref:F-actin-capping protein subunit alpha n=1 Tax=Hymenoscyphus albidus TaxID=595503 RepID=A0A9N9LRY9_9HELO|nr:hypothetical protein HYALB_00000742 [Hymenoscyphus albidus]
MSQLSTVSAFVEGAPPGELADVIADIKALTIDTPGLVSQLGPAFEKYNEEQFATVKLPGGSQHVIVSSHNSLGDGRYYDVESSSSFAFDHATQKASAVQSHVLESSQLDLIKSLLKSLGSHCSEHYPNSSYGVYPIENDSDIAILVVANKYSPNNFWNGRWRSLYVYSPSSSQLKGSLKVDVHYYEDGNVRLLTTKPVSASISTASASAIMREIAVAEKKYQEEINKGFSSLSEGAFKGLRRQLPITRQKIEWDKIAGYRLGQDIGGGSSRKLTLDHLLPNSKSAQGPTPFFIHLSVQYRNATIEHIACYSIPLTCHSLLKTTRTQTLRLDPYLSAAHSLSDTDSIRRIFDAPETVTHITPFDTMSESKVFTYAEVSSHSGKKDLYMVIHDKVYDTTAFVDEHPGGEEVLLDVGGQDATEAFEDVGHSDEAREILDGLLIGDLKRVEGDPKPKVYDAADSPSPSAEPSMGLGLYAIVLLGGAAAFGAYKYMQAQEGKTA